MTAEAGSAPHVAINRRYWNEQASAWFGPLARAHWEADAPFWGIWALPESTVAMFPENVAGMDTIELGCGTGYVSAWLARAGARPVGIDLSERQLATARTMQGEFGLEFPLILGDAERVPLPDASFDLAISEYGASLWCDPRRWIPEAARLLRPGGRLVFLRPTPLLALCSAQDDQPAAETLARPYFGLSKVEWRDCVEFYLPHGEMVRLLRSQGLVVEDLVELQAPADATRDLDFVTAQWARRWPSEEVWKARLVAVG